MGRPIERDMICTITVDTADVHDAHELGGYRTEGYQAVEAIAEVMRAYGMDVEVSYTTPRRKRAKISIRHPRPYEAKRLRDRGGGRPRRVTSYPEYMGSTDEERLAWLEEHSEAEGMEALGVSRRTYYRRLDALRHPQKRPGASQAPQDAPGVDGRQTSIYDILGE